MTSQRDLARSLPRKTTRGNMKRSGHLVCTFGLNRVLQFLVLTSVCWTYQDSRVEATTTCDCADCVSYCTAGWALAKYCGITGPRYEGGVGSGQPSRGVYCVSNCTGLGGMQQKGERPLISSDTRPSQEKSSVRPSFDWQGRPIAVVCPASPDVRGGVTFFLGHRQGTGDTMYCLLKFLSRMTEDSSAPPRPMSSSINFFRVKEGRPRLRFSVELPVVQTTCPAGYQRFQENCFKAFPQTIPDYTWAMKVCLKDEGFLAMPKDAATNAFLVQLKNAVRNDAGFYIGLSDQNAERQWRFADGTALGSYKNWNPGEPNNRGNEYCATLLPGYGGKWNVVPCSSDRRYICQVTPIHPGCSQKATDTTYRYRWDLPQLTGTRFTFQVSAYKAAFIGLSPENHDVTDMYEIVIGIISPTEYRTFWINLAPDGTVSVGKGGVSQPFMSWRDPNPLRVSYAGYSTGWGATGRWKFCSNEVTANPNSSCPVAVGNPSPAALIAVSVVAGVAIALAVAASILYIGKRLELRKIYSDQPLLGRDASYRSIPGHQYETIPGTVRGPLPIPAARVPPAVRHTDIELHGEGEGGRKRRHQMYLLSNGERRYHISAQYLLSNGERRYHISAQYLLSNGERRYHISAQYLLSNGERRYHISAQYLRSNGERRYHISAQYLLSNGERRFHISAQHLLSNGERRFHISAQHLLSNGERRYHISARYLLSNGERRYHISTQYLLSNGERRYHISAQYLLSNGERRYYISAQYFLSNGEHRYPVTPVNAMCIGCNMLADTDVFTAFDLKDAS
ncbi:hypothetical protein Bbelb_117250 [Branchiostoma belcheri]|nr:hypothetical protein Bbelb_117250 [Branchiostoma belcheri]